MRPTKSQAFFMAAALGTVLSAPLAVANTTRSEPRTSAQEKIAERLDRFESVASSMRTEMDHYASSVRGHNDQLFLSSLHADSSTCVCVLVQVCPLLSE